MNSPRSYHPNPNKTLKFEVKVDDAAKTVTWKIDGK